MPTVHFGRKTSRQRLGFKTVTDWLENVPSNAWQQLSAGEGAKGPRLYDWAWLPYWSDAESGWQKGLLIRRKLAQPEAFAFYLTLAPEATGLGDLVWVAGPRWAIAASFEAAKGEVGLDQYEVRSWTGWHRHITLAMLAHAYLGVLRRAAGGEKRRDRSQSRSAAAHRAGSAPSALAPGLAPAACPRGRPPLVALAPPASAAGPPKPLETTN